MYLVASFCYGIRDKVSVIIPGHPSHSFCYGFSYSFYCFQVITREKYEHPSQSRCDLLGNYYIIVRVIPCLIELNKTQEKMFLIFF